MKSFLGYLVLMLVALIPSGIRAQAETTIITESSEPIEDLYLDDVVRKTMIFENRVLPYEELREADVPWQRRMWRIVDVP
jgi:hypothetical protein